MSAKRLLTYNGVTDSLTGWSRRTGIHVMTLHARLRLGWTLEQTLTTPKKHDNPRQRVAYTHNGETHYLSEWARITGISISILGQRLEHGWSLERTLTEPVTLQRPKLGLTRQYRREYQSWRASKARCYYTKEIGYARYGGRGITMCDEWRYDFSAFLRDMGPRPPGTTIDRIDNDGPYAPGNTRWASVRVQNTNQRTNRRISLNGVSRTIGQWAETVAMSPITLRDRLDKQGMSLAEALATPLDLTRRKKSA